MILKVVWIWTAELQRDVVYSILADQKHARIWAQMRGEGRELRGLSHWVQLYPGAQINFGDLTPYIIHDLNPESRRSKQAGALPSEPPISLLSQLSPYFATHIPT